MAQGPGAEKHTGGEGDEEIAADIASQLTEQFFIRMGTLISS